MGFFCSVLLEIPFWAFRVLNVAGSVWREPQPNWEARRSVTRDKLLLRQKTSKSVLSTELAMKFVQMLVFRKSFRLPNLVISTIFRKLTCITCLADVICFLKVTSCFADLCSVLELLHLCQSPDSASLPSNQVAMSLIRSLGIAIPVVLVSADAASVCAWTSDAPWLQRLLGLAVSFMCVGFCWGICFKFCLIPSSSRITTPPKFMLILHRLSLQCSKAF